MASKKELRALITLAGKIDPSLQSAMLKASGESMKLSKNLKKSSDSMSNFATIAKGTFVGSLAAEGISRAADSVMGLASESLKMASDLKEVQNVVDTTFGSSAGQINNWSKQALNAFGLSELQAKQFSGTMGAMLKSSGVAQGDMIKMSQNLSGLAGDFASFYNLDHEDAFTKIRAGISGETEPLKQLGINMSVANLEAFALSKGIKTTYDKMDQASQTMLRYNYLLENSKDAQGDFAKTQGEYANQQRLFDTNLKQISATIASKALPYFNKLFKKGNEFMKNFDVDKAADKVGLAFEYMGDGIQWARDNSYWLIPAVSGVAGSMAALQVINTVSGLYKLWTATTFAQTLATQGLNVALRANPIGLIVTGIGLAIAAGVALYKNWDTIKEKVMGVWEKIKGPFVAIKDWFGSGGKSGNSQAVASISMPAFASGGIATGPSIFGEAGPEMAIPLQRTRRSFGLLNQTAQILGARTGGNNVNVTVNVYSSGGEPKQVGAAAKEAVLSVIEEYFGDRGRVSFG